MENNHKDFMKNRPVVSGANQSKDVYGSMKKSSISNLTIFLSIVILIISVAHFIKGSFLPGILFLVLFVILIVSAIIGSRTDNVDVVNKKDYHKDTIFKDHEE